MLSAHCCCRIAKRNKKYEQIWQNATRKRTPPPLLCLIQSQQPIYSMFIYVPLGEAERRRHQPFPSSALPASCVPAVCGSSLAPFAEEEARQPRPRTRTDEGRTRGVRSPGGANPRAFHFLANTNSSPIYTGNSTPLVAGDHTHRETEPFFLSI